MPMGWAMNLLDDVPRFVQRAFGRKVSGGRTYYEAFRNIPGLNSLANRELAVKGAGLSGLVHGRPIKGLGVGISHTKGLGYFALGFGILGAASSPRGHRMSGFVGGSARLGAFAVGDIIGSALAGPIAGFALGSLTEEIGGKLGEGFQAFSEVRKQLRNVNMGGNYEDTRLAYTMRQRAAQEMGSSVMNARKYLGSEAILMHQ